MNDIKYLFLGIATAFFIVITKAIVQTLAERWSKKEWVGLTDEDMNNALDYWSDKSRSAYGGAHAANGEYVDMIETWRYIETKLKERNT